MIQLKGKQGGILRCTVPEDISETEMLDGFRTIISSGSNIFQGCSVEIDFQSRKLPFSMLAEIRECFIIPSGCAVKCWLSSDAETCSMLESFGLKTNCEEPAKIESASVSRAETAKTGYVYFGNLRSGQSIQHASDVIVLGNVNTGAEVIASGNVTVLGKLCGVVHAGCEGDCGKVVVTRSLEAGQVRIGNKVSMLDETSQFRHKAVSLRIEDNKVQVTQWPELL